jgi:GNAT superfamily N-acetyltransferase
MEIVRAELTDAETLAELNKRLIEDERHPDPMNIAQLTERMREWLATEYICYVAKENGHIVAYCLYRDDGGYYYMRQLYVDRAHRRKGIATRLLDWLYENVWIDKKSQTGCTRSQRRSSRLLQAIRF